MRVLNQITRMAMRLHAYKHMKLVHVTHVSDSCHMHLPLNLTPVCTIFTEGSGPMNTFKASLQLKPNTRPKFMKARPVPFAIKPAVDLELDRLEQEGIIEKVLHSGWASPVVAVPKPGGHLRLCGDYKFIS